MCGDVALNLLFVAEYYFANPDFVRLSEELSLRKHNITVATSFRTVDCHSHLENIDIYEVSPLITIYSIPHTLSFPLAKIHHVIRKKDIRIIHALNDHSTNVLSASFVSIFTKTPFVYTIQGPGTRTGHPLVDTLAKTYDLTLERWIAKKAQKVILLSPSLFLTAKKLEVDENKIVVIPTGIDSKYFDPEQPGVRRRAEILRDKLSIADDDVVIGYVGRLVPAKGLTYLFSAVKRLQKKHPNILLLIVGDGAQRKDLEAIAKSSKIKVIFTGYQHDTVPYYLLMDIFVLPSLFEGLPNVVLEAMSMEKAIVATNVGGNRDALCDGKNGFLVRVRDVQQLALALENLIKNEDLRAQMGIANRRKIESYFSWSRTVEQVEKVYSEIA